MQKYLSEALGTFVLVFLGTLAAVTSKGNVIVTALVFGLTLAVLTAVLGSASGAPARTTEVFRSGGHVNPAVSFGAWLHGSLSTSDIVPYFLAQFGGGAAGSLALRLMLGAGQPPPMGAPLGLGETLFTALSPLSALLLETGLTFLFVSVVLVVSSRERMGMEHRAFLIGGALLVAHLVAIPLTGASLNPARSIAPVVVGANAEAAQQLWVYVLGPFLGGGLAGVAMRFFEAGRKVGG